MGEVKGFNKPDSLSPESSSERCDGDDSASDNEAGDAQAAPEETGESRPTTRRSSLRPAPADYRPSTRDPSQLRPMAVVRAGDAQPTSLHKGNAQPPTSRRYQTSLDSGARLESYKSIADDSFDTPCDRVTPLSIPSAARAAD